MKYTKFSAIKGETDLNKLETIFEKAKRVYKSDYIICQPKYNGVHMIIKDGRAFTRTGKEWNKDILPNDVQHLVRESRFRGLANCTFHLEVFSDTIPFETFVGLISVNRTNRDDRVNTSVYRVFDLDTGQVEPYEQRMQQVFLIAPTSYNFLATNPEEANRAYDYTRSQGDEGVIYRIPPCFYSNDNIPHPAIIKRKRLHTAEGYCLSIEEGLGKRIGMTGALYIQYGPHVIKVGGGKGMDNKRLVDFWIRPPIGKMITFSFEDTAENGMPLRPQFVSIRDYE